jgi:uncharacterized repeat protein (TIGR01451 family)
VISDPFGSADTDTVPVTGGIAPQITVTDPNGTVQVSAATMTKEAAADCLDNPNGADEAFEYAYTLPATGTAATGFWTAAVTGHEGSEGTVSHTFSGAFDVDVPSLLIMKTVLISSDPTGNAIAHSIPGAVTQYTVLVQNNGRGPVDSGTLVITDPIPTHMAFYWTTAGKFIFTDGGISSGLSSPTATFSNNGGATYLYNPPCVPNPPTSPTCTDTTITNVEFTFPGSMNGKTGGTAPSFTITYNVVIQ